MDRAYAEGYYDREKKCAEELKRHWREGWEQGERFTIRACETEKRAINETSFREGYHKAQKEERDRHAIEIHRLQEQFHLQMLEQRTFYDYHIRDTIRTLEEKWRGLMMVKLKKMRVSAAKPHPMASPEASLKREHESASGTSRPKQAERVFFTSLFIFAAPFIAAWALSLQQSRRFRRMC
jgi:hypothetical protein